MDDKSIEIMVSSSDIVRKLYSLFDEVGYTHRFSEEHGEVEVLMDKKWLLFYVDKRVLDAERADDEAFEDAERIEETYWRQ